MSAVAETGRSALAQAADRSTLKLDVRDKLIWSRLNFPRPLLPCGCFGPARTSAGDPQRSPTGQIDRPDTCRSTGRRARDCCHCFAVAASNAHAFRRPTSSCHVACCPRRHLTLDLIRSISARNRTRSIYREPSWAMLEIAVAATALPSDDSQDLTLVRSEHDRLQPILDLS